MNISRILTLIDHVLRRAPLHGTTAEGHCNTILIGLAEAPDLSVKDKQTVRQICDRLLELQATGKI